MTSGNSQTAGAVNCPSPCPPAHLFHFGSRNVDISSAITISVRYSDSAKLVNYMSMEMRIRVVAYAGLQEYSSLLCNARFQFLKLSPISLKVHVTRQMEPPMSEWFQSIPITLDSVANAAKFQHETMAAQIRYHRTRYQQQRVLIERLRHDLAEFKKLNEQLQDDNNRLRQHTGKKQLLVAESRPDQQEGFHGLNANGKRPYTGAPFYDQTGAQAANSSPRSIATPRGPNRLTLPRGQTASNISNAVENIHNPPSANDRPSPSVALLPQSRPASSFINKYSYVPPTTPQFHRPQLTHAQMTAQNYKRIKPDSQAQSQPHFAQHQTAQIMPPPPTPARFRTARTPQSSVRSTRNIQTQDLPSGYTGQRHEMAETSSQSTKSRQSEPQAGQKNQNSFERSEYSSSGTNHLHPQAQRLVPSTSTGHVLKAPMGNGPQRFFPAGTRAPYRAQQADSSGRQRMPFLARNQTGDERYVV